MTGDEIKKILQESFLEIKNELISVIINHDREKNRKIILIFSCNENIDIKNKIDNYIHKIFENIEVSFVFAKKFEMTEGLIGRLIKDYQPVNLDSMKAILQKNMVAFTEEGLNRQLDNMRKKKLLIRSKINGCYSLTEKYLSEIPHGKYRTSSDISRILALNGKRT